ncbi:unnamed protein product [Albugo candida]|uniref:Uncharacterized protein n=1 Tax=Albugo candida TaxID=65357 RepID=A0A024FVH7_9STRA|nr:unnamed protein product [Albugo candida]|eukprot:CCI10917.1 unnamed protein product [Albugo candida]
MRAFRVRFSLGLFWFLMVVKTLRCKCPYENGFKIKLDKELYKRLITMEIEEWPSALHGSSSPKGEDLKECKRVCILSHGLKVIEVREKIEDLTCEETLEEKFYDAQNTPLPEDVSTTQHTSNTKRRKMFVLSESAVFA